MKVAIIGAGELGSALSEVLEKQNDHEVFSWDKDPKKVTDQKDIGSVVKDAKVVFFCIPSWEMRDALSLVSSQLSDDVIVVSCSKGMDDTHFMDEVLEELLPDVSHALLSGPMLAEELLAKKFGYAVLASSDIEIFTHVGGLFDKTSLVVSHSADIRGVASCGVLKNIYTLGLGMVEGLKLGSNSFGQALMMASNEMLEITLSLGGEPETVFSTAGLADLVATATSKHSQNHAVGVEIAKKKTCCAQSEGTRCIESLVNVVGDVSQYRFLHTIQNTMQEPKNVKKNITSLLTQ